MEHVVFFPSPDGAPAFRRLGSLDEAVRLVEHLRNVEGVSQVSCHTLSEVPLAFRAYYRVEVDGASPARHEESPRPEPVLTAVAEPEHEDEYEPVIVMEAEREPSPQDEHDQQEDQDGRHLVVAQAGSAGSNGQAGGGAKSLGFFA